MKMTGKNRLVSVLSVLILLFSCHTGRLALLKNTNSSSTSRYRSLLQSLSQETIASSHYISHHHGHNIPGTSTPALPHILKTMIENVTSTTLNVSDTSPAFIKSVRASLQQLLVEDLSHDSTKKDKLLEGINHDSRLTARAHSLHGLGAQSDETLSDLVDIVIPITSIGEASMNFLSDWKDFIKGLHAIIILAQGISLQSLTVPEWLDYIVYTRSDVERVLAGDSWLIPMEVLLLHYYYCAYHNYYIQHHYHYHIVIVIVIVIVSNRRPLLRHYHCFALLLLHYPRAIQLLPLLTM